MDTMADVSIMDAKLFHTHLRAPLARMGCHLHSFPLSVSPFSPGQKGERVLGFLPRVPVNIEGTVFSVTFAVLPCTQQILLGMPFHHEHVYKACFWDNTYELSVLPRDQHCPGTSVTVVVDATTTHWQLQSDGRMLECYDLNRLY